MSHGQSVAGVRPAGRPLLPHIQALRALAVAAVFGGHLVGLPQGGALGVDVFFVISGFLITGGLLREWEASGTVSLRNFYSRRARRILPAALVVLLCVTAVSLVIRSVELTPNPLHHGVASLFFVENWYLAHLGGSPEPLSAVQHYWSLSIEEQFYLIWPLALLVLLGLARMLTPTWSGPRFGGGRARTGGGSIFAVGGQSAARRCVRGLSRDYRSGLGVGCRWRPGVGRVARAGGARSPRLGSPGCSGSAVGRHVDQERS